MITKNELQELLQSTVTYRVEPVLSLNLVTDEEKVTKLSD